jgi:pilus assembly protein TadC
MSAGERLAGAAAALVALCCALLPVAGAAFGGGLIAGTRGIGVLVGALVLVAAVVLVGRRRRSRRC